MFTALVLAAAAISQVEAPMPEPVITTTTVTWLGQDAAAQKATQKAVAAQKAEPAQKSTAAQKGKLAAAERRHRIFRPRGERRRLFRLRSCARGC
jgi:hypothetical protein